MDAPSKSEQMTLFMLYWGQQVVEKLTDGSAPAFGRLATAGHNQTIGYVKPGASVTSQSKVDKMSLLVRPTTTLVDEEVLKLERSFPRTTFCGTREENIKSIRDTLDRYTPDMISSAGMDYLRENGFATPFKKWSVQDLRELGVYQYATMTQ